MDRKPECIFLTLTRGRGRGRGPILGSSTFKPNLWGYDGAPRRSKRHPTPHRAPNLHVLTCTELPLTRMPFTKVTPPPSQSSVEKWLGLFPPIATAVCHRDRGSCQSSTAWLCWLLNPSRRRRRRTTTATIGHALTAPPNISNRHWLRVSKRSSDWSLGSWPQEDTMFHLGAKTRKVVLFWYCKNSSFYWNVSCTNTSSINLRKNSLNLMYISIYWVFFSPPLKVQNKTTVTPTT